MDLDEYHKYVRMHLTLKLDLSDANLEAFMGAADKEKKSLLNNVLGVLGASKSKGKSVKVSLLWCVVFSWLPDPWQLIVQDPINARWRFYF